MLTDNLVLSTLDMHMKKIIRFKSPTFDLTIDAWPISSYDARLCS
jgi:hypothetical protein